LPWKNLEVGFTGDFRFVMKTETLKEGAVGAHNFEVMILGEEGHAGKMVKQMIKQAVVSSLSQEGGALVHKSQFLIQRE
jgi:hypothetical protein